MTKKKVTKALARRTPQVGLATREDVERVQQAATDYARAAKASNTTAAYATARAHYETWCHRFGVEAWVPKAEVIAAYLSDLASQGAAYNTVALHRAAIGVHFRIGLNVNPPTKDPRVREVMQGIRRKSPPPSQRAPLTLDLLSTVIATLRRESPLGDFLRDRAVILFGVATGLRGEQIAALAKEDLRFVDQGIVVKIHREKTDQLGKGRFVVVPRVGGGLCPVGALDEWIAWAHIDSGPVFRGFRRGGHPSQKAITRRDVWAIVKQAAGDAGLDPEEFGAHSLRAGFITSARARGMDWGDIMRQSGHKRIETAMKYERPKEDDPAAFERLAKVWKGENK